ncbi:MAG: endonuclease NucS [Sulfolobales archaeon]|nr:endonuclease NucS [Sulfolobales archaeon]MDW7969382.1 endonuclease NucS [Sulfolobales archaeon]
MVLVGNCEVFYEGRASSKASEARRLIVIKEDGSLIIHEGKGIDPINWQPNAVITTKVNEESFEIKAMRSRPKEVVKVYIKDKPHLMLLKLRKGLIILKGTEDDMVDYIASNPSIIESDAKLIAKEFITPHGRIDLILRNSKDELILVECKRAEADLDAVHQLIRYVDYYRGLGLNVKGYIASQSITPNAYKLLIKSGLNYVEISSNTRVKSSNTLNPNTQ